MYSGSCWVHGLPTVYETGFTVCQPLYCFFKDFFFVKVILYIEIHCTKYFGTMKKKFCTLVPFSWKILYKLLYSSVYKTVYNGIKNGEERIVDDF